MQLFLFGIEFIFSDIYRKIWVRVEVDIHFVDEN